jgi:hypothetical protein
MPWQMKSGAGSWLILAFLIPGGALVQVAPALAQVKPPLPQQDVAFLRQMTRDVVEASRVRPGSNGGGGWPLTNTCGFALITPGKDTYRAFWIRDFSMALDSGLIGTNEIVNHLMLVCRVQNGPQERILAHGLHVPPWSIPDHINYDGGAVWFPGTYDSGTNQGDGTFGRVPPIDDHFEFVHIAYCLWQMAGDQKFLAEPVQGFSLIERLEKAFAAPTADPASGLAQTTESDRAVGFGFCDAEVHTGKLLFASLLRYRAADEMAQLEQALGHKILAAGYRATQKQIRSHVFRVFGAAAGQDGWLRASTGISGQPDAWGTLFALHLGVLDGAAIEAARQAVARATRAGTIAFEGGVRHVPTDCDFSKTSAWERSVAAVNTYQNGAYWHTASGWLIEALWPTDRLLALAVWQEMFAHLRSQDYRQGSGCGAPWETFGRNGQARQNAVYLASVAVPLPILERLK